MKYILSVLVALWVFPVSAEYALIFKDKVAQISPTQFQVHPSMTWVDIAAVNPKPKHGWAYSGGVFTAPPPPPAPPTDMERFDGETGSVVLKAIIHGLAEMRGKTPAEVRAWLRSKL